MDLPDIKSALAFGNPSVSSQAISSLIGLLDKKNKTEALSVFFDSLFNYGPEMSSWISTVIPKLIDKGVFTIDVVEREMFSRVGDDEKVNGIALNLLWKLLPDDHTRLALLAVKKSSLVRMVVEKALKCEEKEVLFVLMMCSDVSADLRLFMFNQLEFEKDFSDYFLTSFVKTPEQRVLKSLDIAIELKNNIKILEELDVSPNHCLIPSILSTFSACNEMNKAVADSYDLNKLKTLMVKSLKVDLLEDIGELGDYQNNNDFMRSIAKSFSHSYVNMWINKVENYSSREYGEESVYVACFLLPYVKDYKGLELVVTLTRHCPKFSNTLLPLFMMLVTKPYFDVNVKDVMKAIKGITCSKYVVSPIAKFLCTLVGRKDDLGLTAIRILEEIVMEFPSILDDILPLTTITSNDNEEWIRARLNLLRNLFLTSNRSDDLLPILSNYLKKDGPILSSSLEVLSDICLEEELDLSTLKKQLSSKVFNGNEQSLGAYCKLLGLVSEMNEEEDKDLRKECLTELWSLTSFGNADNKMIAEGRAAAWRQLAKFPLDELSEITGNDVIFVTLGLNLSEIEVKGFSVFLRSILNKDVDLIPKLAYTKSFEVNDVITSNSAVWYDMLCRTNAESPWVWKATLSSYSSILRNTSISKRQLLAMKTLRRLLCETSVSENLQIQDFFELTADWRIVVSELLNILAQSKNADYSWARDQICNECDKALRQSESSLSNVLLVITTMAMELHNISKNLTASDSRRLNTELQAWLLSVSSFIISQTDGSVVSITGNNKLLFEIVVKSTETSQQTAQYCHWMLSSCPYGPLVEAETSEVIESTKKLFQSESELTQFSQHINSVGSERCKLSRKTVWLFTTALGVDPVIASALDDEVQTSQDTMSRIDDILKKDNGDLVEYDIKELFELLVQLTSVEVLKYQSRVKRCIDRAWTNSNDFKRSIYEGISLFVKYFWIRDKTSLPYDYSSLPDSSIIKSLITLISKKDMKSHTTEAFLTALYPINRSDGRHLPPLEWSQFLGTQQFMSNSHFHLPLLRIACQEKSKKLIYKLCKYEWLSNLSDDLYTTLLDHLEIVLESLPLHMANNVLTSLYGQLPTDDNNKRNKFVDVMDSLIHNPVVFNFILSNLPTFEQYGEEEYENLFLKLGNVDERFYGQISREFDFYLDAKMGNHMDFKKLVNSFDAAPSQHVMLQILGIQLSTLKMDELVTLMMNLVSVHRIFEATSGFKSSTGLFFLVLVAAAPSEFPFPWVGPKDINQYIHARWFYHWKRVLGCLADKHLTVIKSFLLSHLVHNDNVKETRTYREMLFSIFDRSLPSSAELLEMSKLQRELLFVVV